MLRKTHSRKDAVAAQAFKVELANRLGKLDVSPEAKVRIWMPDEHRDGLISGRRKVWTLLDNTEENLFPSFMETEKSGFLPPVPFPRFRKLFIPLIIP